MNISSHELFKQATYSFRDIVKSISIRTIFEDELEESNNRVDLSVVSGSVIEQRHRLFGRCYTYCPEQSIRDLGVYYLKIKL